MGDFKRLRRVGNDAYNRKGKNSFNKNNWEDDEDYEEFDHDNDGSEEQDYRGREQDSDD